MNAVHDSTIAAMFYALPPALNFAQLVSDLDAGLSNVPHDLRRLSWDCDDVAVFDIDGSRILLSLAERLPGPRKTCLSIAVGPNHHCTAPDRFADRRAAVAMLLVSRISQRMPPDEVVWHGAAGVLDADALDSATDVLLAEREAEDMARIASLASADAARPRPRQWPVSFERLMARVEAEIGATRDPFPARATVQVQPVEQIIEAEPIPAPEPDELVTAPAKAAALTGEGARRKARASAEAAVAIANDVPDLPPRAFDDAMRIRAALYPPEETPGACRASTPARLAVSALGTTLIFVVAPVGGAILTYNALRGADLVLTARAVALTGAVMGIGELPALQAFLSFV